MITGVILARNEEPTIVGCLETLRPHVEEIILIDMESEDRTAELARPLVDRLLSHSFMDNFDSARNIAIPEARFDWLWFVDADERVTPAAAELVRRVIRERGGQYEAIVIPFMNFCCGKWIKHSGWWPGMSGARVLKRGHGQYNPRIHGGLQVNGRVFIAPADPELATRHYGIRDVTHYAEKVSRYATAEAQNLFNAGRLWDWRQGLHEMLSEMYICYERFPGHLDGPYGWIVAWMSGQYRWLANAKMIDLTDEFDHADVPRDLDELVEAMSDSLAVLRRSRPSGPLDIVWRGEVSNASGYAEESRAFLRALAEGDRALSLVPLSPIAEGVLSTGDKAFFSALSRSRRPRHSITVTHFLPGAVGPDERSTLNIIRTMVETDRLPDGWREHVGQYDEVWVPAEHSAVAFRQSGVPPERIRVVPECLDEEVFAPHGPHRRLPDGCEGRFVFLSVFDWLRRKGWDTLTQAYAQEFGASDGAALLLKVGRIHGCTRDVVCLQIDAALRDIGQSLKRRPDILIFDETLSTWEMAALYRSVDAFVLASRGEGWGRPYMEAMACGTPTIGTAVTGNLAFMRPENSFLVPATKAPVPPEASQEFPLIAGHHWYECDRDELRRALRQVREDKDERIVRAKKGSDYVRAALGLKSGREAVERAVAELERSFAVPRKRSVTGEQIAVLWEGELFANHSFSNINERLIAELDRDESFGVSVHRVVHQPTTERTDLATQQLRSLLDRELPAGPDVVIRHAFPPDWERPEQGKWVHIQPWEFGCLPQDWVGPLVNDVDEIWAPSNYVRRVYERSGVATEKIHVVPWGVDTHVFNPQAPPLHLRTEKTFRFLFVGGAIRRKGFDRLLKAYAQEFSGDDDVCLVVKDLGGQSFYGPQSLRDEVFRLQADATAPELLYIEADLTAGQLASMYTACDCLVAPYRGEGFGLPILEAMACGLPPIVPAGGASDDFVEEEFAYMLSSREVEIDFPLALCGPAMELEIENDELRAVMRRAFEDRRELSEKGRLAANAASQSWSWSKTVERIKGRLEQLATCSSRSSTGKVLPSPLNAAPRAATFTTIVEADGDQAAVANQLARLKPYAREIILVGDRAGSTAAIAREYGVRVVDGAQGDLMPSDALHIDSDWYFTIHSTDSIDGAALERLSSTLAKIPTREQTHRVSMLSSSGGGSIDVAMFRARPTVREPNPSLTAESLIESWLLPHIPCSGRGFIDIGANRGVWSRFLAERFERGYAIEPNPVAIARLRTDVPGNVEVYDVGAWSHEVTMPFTTFSDDRHFSAIFREAGINTGNAVGQLEIHCKAIDTLGLAGPIDFIKCDVEGAELKCLLGCAETIRRDRPKLIVEIHTQDNFQVVSNLLSAWDYQGEVVRHPDYSTGSEMWSRHGWIVGTPLSHRVSRQ